jgi:hypothetical protein
MSLFKRLLKGKLKLKKTPKQKGDDDDSVKYYPEDSLAIDERFTNNFRKNGGKFLYCIDAQEINEAFDNILLENNWYEKDVFCINEMLSKKFDGYNLNFTNNTTATFFLTSCESLISKKWFHFTLFKPN